MRSFIAGQPTCHRPRHPRRGGGRQDSRPAGQHQRRRRSLFAAAKLDAVFVPLNFRARADEIAYMLNDSAPKALLAGSRYAELIEGIKPQIESVETFVALGRGSGRLAFLLRAHRTGRRRRTLAARRRGRPHRPDVHRRNDGLPQGSHAQPQQLLFLHTQQRIPSRPRRRRTQHPDRPALPHSRNAGDDERHLRRSNPHNPAPVRAGRVDEPSCRTRKPTAP